MASSLPLLILKTPPLINAFVALLLLATVRRVAATCYSSIVSFGDSLADTGNNVLISLSKPGEKLPRAAFPPYGDTFFHHPTGRCSNGRLVIDFIAESLGLPLIPPYFEVKNKGGGEFPQQGVNFAVAGATALDDTFFKDRGIHVHQNISLGAQLGWFKQLLPTICSSPSDCGELLSSTLFLMGEIGGNDYNYPFLNGGRSVEEMREFVSPVINTIASVINEVIELGAMTILVPGNLPIGCSASYLTNFNSGKKDEYDNSTGCLNWLNAFSEYHNEQLKLKLDQIREIHPHANIIYADYYNAAMQFYRSPEKFGFKGGAITACCGAGGPYNCDLSAYCGARRTSVCSESSHYVAWDGIHLTEAAYRWISKGLLEDGYTAPRINVSCANVKRISDGRYSTY